jgi:hypothetical protein
LFWLNSIGFLEMRVSLETKRGNWRMGVDNFPDRVFFGEFSGQKPIFELLV